MKDTNYQFLAIASILLSIGGAWLATNTDQVLAGAVYAFFGLMSALVYLEHKDLGLGELLIGVSTDKKQNKRNLMLGVVFGVGFALLSRMFPSFTIGNLDNLPLAVIVAFLEEISFRGVLQSILNRYMPWYQATFIQCISFTGFHIAVYGLSELLAFPAAFLFGFMTTVLSNRTKSQTSNIVGHGIVNASKFI